MAEFHEGVQLVPCFGVVEAKDPEIDFEFLIDSFCFSISLGVVGGTPECLHSEELHYLAEYLKGKLGSSVREERLRKAKTFEHMFNVIQGCLNSINCLVTGNRDYPLYRSVVDNNHETVVAIANQQICDEITGYLGKWGGVSLAFDRYQAG